MHIAHFSLLEQKYKSLSAKKRRNQIEEKRFRRLEEILYINNIGPYSWEGSFFEGFACFGTDQLVHICQSGIDELAMEYGIRLTRKQRLHNKETIAIAAAVTEKGGNHNLGYNPYEKGYKFFKEIVGILYDEEDFKHFLDIATNPPLNEMEILYPENYLHRNNIQARYSPQKLNLLKELIKTIKYK